MIKSAELSNPDSCMSRAKPEEMVFVLLARDEAAPLAIQMWCNARVIMGKNKWTDPQIQEALDCAFVMESQRKAYNIP